MAYRDALTVSSGPEFSNRYCKSRHKELTCRRATHQHFADHHSRLGVFVLLVLTEDLPFFQRATLVGDTCPSARRVSSMSRSGQLTNQEDSSLDPNPRPPPDILQHATLNQVAKVLHHGILVEAGSNQCRERELKRSARCRMH
jgi:hypothetical protein